MSDGSELQEILQCNASDISILRLQYKAALELIEELETTIAEMLEALELIERCDEKGFINLKPAWHNQVRQAIRKAKPIRRGDD